MVSKGIAALQAKFRGDRARSLHVDRVEKNLAWSPYVGSRPEAVSAMLQLAKVTSEDVVMDLGSGDGRVLLAAVNNFGASRAIGYEIDPVLVAQSRKNAIGSQKNANQIQIFCGDWTEDSPEISEIFNDVTVVTLFFLPHPSLANVLKSRLRPGTRVISYAFNLFPEWTPVETIKTVPCMNTNDDDSLSSTASLYII